MTDQNNPPTSDADALAMANKEAADVSARIKDAAPDLPPEIPTAPAGDAPASSDAPKPKNYGVMETGFLGLVKIHKERFPTLAGAVDFASEKRGDQTPIAFY